MNTPTGHSEAAPHHGGWVPGTSDLRGTDPTCGVVAQAGGAPVRVVSGRPDHAGPLAVTAGPVVAGLSVQWQAAPPGARLSSARTGGGGVACSTTVGSGRTDSLIAVMLDLAGVPDRPGETDWRSSAACARVDPDLFYPPKGGTSRPARRICASCRVRVDCLRIALEDGEEYGVWGGLTADQRRVLRRRARRLVRGGHGG